MLKRAASTGTSIRFSMARASATRAKRWERLSVKKALRCRWMIVRVPIVRVLDARWPCLSAVVCPWSRQSLHTMQPPKHFFRFTQTQVGQRFC